MLLAIDVGNTNTVFAVVDDGKIIREWRSGTTAGKTADEYIVWLSSLLAISNIDVGQIKKVIISTVVPQGLFNLITLGRRYLNYDPYVVESDVLQKVGITVSLPEPREVGSDRLVNAVSAYSEYNTDMIIIDFGTATTFDIVSDQGVYLGGVIVPGVNLGLEVLHTAAAKLPGIAIIKPEQVIGKSTVSAMQSGVFWGSVSMIEGVVSRIKSEYGKPMKVIATGGLSEWFNNATQHIDIVDRDLTIKGLIIIDKLILDSMCESE